MALLDRFRRPAQWKQEDPLARIAAVEELPLDQQELLITIAREDGDARVRRAAVRKIIEPAAVADVARTDRDDSVRDEATAILRDLALGVFENTAEAESLAALALLTDLRDVITVAESASLESVWQAAIARLDDSKALGAVARRASLPAARLEALRRIVDPAEVCAVALKSEHKDVAVAAVDRLTDAEALKLIATKGTTKAAARRARVLLGPVEAEGQPAADAAPPEALEGQGDRARRVELCRLVELLARGTGTSADLSARLRQAEAAWSQLPADADPELAGRFATACQAAVAHVSRIDADEAARRRITEETAAGVAARTGLCDRVQALDGDDAPARLEEARAAWRDLPPMPHGQDAQARALARRFDEAASACERRYARLMSARALDKRAELVCQEAERVAATARFPESVPHWASAARAWKDVLAAGFAGNELVARFSQAEERFRAGEAAAREQQARQRQVSLERLQRLCARAEGLIANPSLSLKDAERSLRDLRAMLDEVPALPQKQDHEDVTGRMKALHAALVPKVQELREIDEWQRWANAGIQEQLCRRAEALAQVADITDVARQLREIQEEWKKASLVPREKAQALWARFRAAADQARARCSVYFAQQAEERGTNLARKEALCQQAEALAESTDWIRTAEAIKALQAEWKAIGLVPRGQEQAVWERFRKACDRFFTRRHEDLAHRKEEWAANLARKLALCERVEALAASTDWERGIEEIKRAQAEWKASGPVRKNRAETIWQRFRAACDAFFERYRERDNAKLAAERAEREILCAELEALPIPAAGSAAASPAPLESPELAPQPESEMPAEMTAAPVAAAPEPAAPLDDLVDRVMRIRDRWIELGQAESSPRTAWAALHERFAGVLDRVLEAHAARFVNTPLDADATRRVMIELCEKVERTLSALRPPPEAAASPAAVLARQLREALAANTIGGRAPTVEVEAKWRAAEEEVGQARARWQTLGPVPGEVGRTLARRFEQACHRFALQRERQLRPSGSTETRTAPSRSGMAPSRRP